MRALIRWALMLLALLTAALCVVHCQESELPQLVEKRAEPVGQVEPWGKEATLEPTGIPDAPSVRRLVSFGDVHGDLDATRKVLRLVGAIDEKDRWIGGDMRLVHTGDVLDRGDNEKAILDLFFRLQKEARSLGGDFVILNGNHEVMNVQWNFSYVTPGGWIEFQSVTGLPDPLPPALKAYPPEQRPRAFAFMPGGPYAKKLATFPLIRVIDGNLFVHGGALPKHIDYGIEKLNKETAAWMRGETKIPPFMDEFDSPIWNRDFAFEPDANTCLILKQTLDKAGAVRMVIGHTPYPQGISPACNEKVWRIDTGMSKHYGGVVQALELTKGREKIWKQKGP